MSVRVPVCLQIFVIYGLQNRGILVYVWLISLTISLRAEGSGGRGKKFLGTTAKFGHYLSIFILSHFD